MRPITLNDGTYIYSAETAINYLSSLGFDFEDLCNLFKMTDDFNEYISEEYVRRDHVDNWERIADSYYNNYNEIQNQIEELADKLASGKGGTKVQYAAKFKEIVSQGI